MTLLLLFGGAGEAESVAGGRIEFGFGSTWKTAPGSITWTDVTEYVLHPGRLNVKRGASAARGLADVGTCSFSLLNIDRRFDPTHTAGPYFGDLKPGVPVRVTMTPEGGSSGVVFRGHVASWPQRYDVGNTFAYVPIEAFDGFDKLSRAKIPRSVLEKEILADSPAAYWPLNETTGVGMSDRSGNLRSGSYREGTTGLSATVEFDDGGRVEGIGFDGDHWGYVKDGGVVVGARPAIVELVAAPTDTGGAMIALRTGDGNGSGLSGITFQISGFSDGEYAWAMSARVGGNDFINTRLLKAGDPHHVAYRAPAAGDAEVYVDGVEDTSDTAETTPSSSTPVTTGSTVGARKPNGQGAFTGFIGHVAIFDTDIGAVRIAAHAAAAVAPLDGQTTDERIDWILDEIGWPSGLVDLETGQSPLGAATFQPGDKALDYLRLVEASEDGRLFIAADGTLRFLDRYWRYTATEATVSQFTFSDAGDPDESGYAEFQLDIDDELLVNTARYTRRGGTEQVVTDQVSVDEYGEAETQKSDLLLGTDNQVLSLAQWKVLTSSTPQPRCPSIRVPLHRYTAAAANAVLALDLGYRVSVERTPQGVGDPIELDLVVDGVSHDFGGGEWWVTLFVSPAPDATVSLFTLDLSELDGVDVLAY